MYYIYCIVFPNNKKYIGQTNNIKRRIKEHLNYTKCCYKPNTLVDKKIAEIKDATLLQILTLGISKTRKEANDAEEYWINKYGTTVRQGKGYNIRTTAYIYDMSTSTKEKLSLSKRGNKNPRYGKPSPSRGRICTEEEKEYNRQAHLGKTAWNKGKKLSYMSGHMHPGARKVICIETGEIFDCIKYASIKYNKSISNIIACCKGERKTSSGLHWSYYKGERNE